MNKIVNSIKMAPLKYQFNTNKNVNTIHRFVNLLSPLFELNLHHINIQRLLFKIHKDYCLKHTKRVKESVDDLSKSIWHVALHIDLATEFCV